MKKLSLVLVLVLSSLATLVAQRSITGTVTDDQGEALIGATVLVEGTGVGTVTDIDGNYSLQVPAEGKVLVFSYTGYSSLELEIGASRCSRCCYVYGRDRPGGCNRRWLRSTAS